MFKEKYKDFRDALITSLLMLTIGLGFGARKLF